MEEIYEPNEYFPFDKLVLTKPTQVSGGNYFIRFLLNNEHLYIQPPKCSMKQGIVKGPKKIYTDLLFSNENETFIQWLEKLETTCVEYIYQNRNLWFEMEMEKGDIEKYMISPIKTYKSGKLYVVRVNLSSINGVPTMKIYDESEKEIPFDTISENMKAMTILEIQGIKCSATSFQFELEMKQMMILKSTNIFEKCLLRPTNTKTLPPSPPPLPPPPMEEQEQEEENDFNTEEYLGKMEENNSCEPIPSPEKPILEEIQIYLDDLEDTTEKFELKKRNEVYYNLYKEARKKAKIAKEMALNAYLEAENIKKTYLLEDIISDSDEESDFEGEGDFDLEKNDSS
jgi:hypothetical protein